MPLTARFAIAPRGCAPASYRSLAVWPNGPTSETASTAARYAHATRGKDRAAAQVGTTSCSRQRAEKPTGRKPKSDLERQLDPDRELRVARYLSAAYVALCPRPGNGLHVQEVHRHAGRGILVGGCPVFLAAI